MKRKQLTTAFVARRDKAPGRYQDGAGLMLVVKATGGQSWIQRITIRGKRRDVGLGSLDFVSLREARAKAHENRRIAREGGDPTRQAPVRAVPTFAEALDAVLAIQAGAWRNAGKSEAQWRASLQDHAGALMPMTVDAIGSADVLGAIGPIWNAKRETARRVKQRIGAVMKWAIAEGHRTDNPVDTIGAALPKNGVHKAHHRALAYGAVSGALAAVASSRAGHGQGRGSPSPSSC